MTTLPKKRRSIVNRFEKIHDYFLSTPQRIVQWGFRMSLIGMALICCGLIGRLLMIVVPTSAKGGIKLPMRNLDTFLPYFPTWWIPESGFGYFVAVMMIVTGLIVYGTGKRMMTLLAER
jgi:hypothetical protein